MPTVELETEVRSLAQRLNELEKAVVYLMNEIQQPSRAESTDSSVSASTDRAPGNAQELLTWMRKQGLIVDPPPATIEYSRRWRALSVAERQAIQWELDHIPPGVTVSELIAEGRS